jgi:hypothetical protein
MLIARVLIGLGLAALGYYVGREVGRAEPIRRALEASRGRTGGRPPAGPDGVERRAGREPPPGSGGSPGSAP